MFPSSFIFSLTMLLQSLSCLSLFLIHFSSYVFSSHLASTVNLAMQTDFGERLQSQFSPSASLLDVLKHWEGEPGR